MNHARITHIIIFLSARSVRRMPNSSVDRTWTVIDGKWIRVEGGLCVILSFEQLKFFVGVCYSLVGVRSLCVVDYICEGHAVSAYASELVRHSACPRPSTDAPPYHAWTAHVSRSFHWHPLTKVLVSGTFAKRACLDALRQWFMRRACVECSWNTTLYSWLVSDCKWCMRGSCVIRQWFLSPTPPKFGQFLDAQARTNPISAWFVSDSCVIGCVTGP